MADPRKGPRPSKSKAEVFGDIDGTRFRLKRAPNGSYDIERATRKGAFQVVMKGLVNRQAALASLPMTTGPL